MSSTVAQRLRVFVSSRMAELAPERRLVKEALDELNVDAWVFEKDAGARPESIEETFLEEVERADLYLGIFWRGHGPYTREEYDHAQKEGKDRLVYEKRADLEAKREPELQEFLDELNRVETGVTPRRFESPGELREYVKEDVARWQTRVIRQRSEIAETVSVLEQQLAGSEEEREFLKDQVRSLTEAVTALASQRGQPEAPAGLEAALEELSQGRVEAAQELFLQVAADSEALGAESFRKSAEAQRHYGALAFLHDTQDSIAAYRRATELDPDNVEGWNQLGHLLVRVGELAGAKQAYEEVLRLAQAEENKQWEAAACGNLGVVYQTQGALDRAVEMFEKSLALNEALGRTGGSASQYGNLGNVYRIREDLDRATEMYDKSLALNETLGRKDGMAADYSNLGTVYATRGDLDRAVETFEKSLALNETLGRKDGMASCYGNLGIVYQIQGDLDRAVLMIEKSLALEKELGRKEGMAADYANLGVVYQTQGDLGLAVEAWETSRNLYGEIGIPHMVTQLEGWLSEVKEPE